MLKADALLSALHVANLPISGFTIRDPDDPQTWTFYGEGVTPEMTAQAIVIAQTPQPSAQVVAQRTIDSWPIEYVALVLALIDQLNVLRSKLTPPLPAITPQQALASIRQKAGQL